MTLTLRQSAASGFTASTKARRVSTHLTAITAVHSVGASSFRLGRLENASHANRYLIHRHVLANVAGGIQHTDIFVQS